MIAAQTALSTPLQIPVQGPHVAAAQAFLELLNEVDALAIRLKQRAELPRAEHVVLDILTRLGPLTVPQIARQRCTSRQNIQVQVDRLLAEGRVELKGNPAHKKSALVSLTERGKNWLEVCSSGRKELLLGAGSGFSEAEIRQAAAVINKVRDSLSPERNAGPVQRMLPPSPELAATPQERTQPVSSSKTAPDDEFPVNLL